MDGFGSDLRGEYLCGGFGVVLVISRLSVEILAGVAAADIWTFHSRGALVW
jgi:hypothetical protein